MRVIDLGSSKSYLAVWNNFVLNHNNGNAFQSPEMFIVNEYSNNFEPFGIGVIDSENNILGILCGVIQKKYFWPLTKITSRIIIQGGPILRSNDEKVLSLLLKELIDRYQNKVIYIQIRNLWNQNFYTELFSSFGFKYEPHLDILIDLKQSEDTIFKKISKNKKRNVTKSLNKGTIFREIVDFYEYKQAIKLIQSTYKRIGLPLPDLSHFISIYKTLLPLNKIKIFCAEFNGKIIGIRIELLYNKIIYDWWAGSLENINDKYVNDFLPFHIIFWGIKNNFEYFDFGGAGKPNEKYGVRDHKIKFGGELVEYGRFEKVNKPALMKIANIGLAIYKHIR